MDINCTILYTVNCPLESRYFKLVVLEPSKPGLIFQAATHVDLADPKINDYE